jgi:hypothetical protein
MSPGNPLRQNIPTEENVLNDSLETSNYKAKILHVK